MLYSASILIAMAVTFVHPSLGARVKASAPSRSTTLSTKASAPASIEPKPVYKSATCGYWLAQNSNAIWEYTISGPYQDHPDPLCDKLKAEGCIGYSVTECKDDGPFVIQFFSKCLAGNVQAAWQKVTRYSGMICRGPDQNTGETAQKKVTKHIG